jgi:hypothetical protein
MVLQKCLRINNMKRLLTALLTVFISYASYADESNFSFMIGDTTINVRAPSGFYESSYINSEVLDIVKMLYPSEVYDIHAVLIPADYDTSPSSRSIVLASLKAIDAINISKQDFIDIKDEFVNQQFTIMNSAMETINENLVDSMDEINEKYDTDINWSFNETTPLGVFMDEEDAMAFSVIMAGDFSEDYLEEGFFEINSLAVMNLNNRLVIAYVYSEFESNTDIIWVEAKTKELIGLFRMVNNQD